MPRRFLRVAAASAAALLLLGACGGDDGDPPAGTGAGERNGSASEGGFPVTIRTDGGDVTIESRPERIVSISPTATEMLFAIGAGEQVAAVDSLSNHPAGTPVTDLSAFQPNVEAILGYDPDLVILSFDPGDVVAGLQGAGVATVVQAAAETLDDTYAQIEQLGAATGRVGDAAEVVASMRARIDELAARAPERAEPLTYFHELDDQLYTVTSRTFIGEIYALAGLESVADEADAQQQTGGYPQLSAEYLVARDPDFIFLADTICCAQTAETVAARPGWSNLTAVREGRIVELDDDVASRWGPRVVDLLEVIIEATAPVGAARR